MTEVGLFMIALALVAHAALPHLMRQADAKPTVAHRRRRARRVRVTEQTPIAPAGWATFPVEERP